MGASRGWSKATWEDPDGGTILLHGTFPTVVLPRSIWPSPKAWQGLALLDDAGAPDAWKQEEEDERASPGVNLEAARFGIGHEAHLLSAGGTRRAEHGGTALLCINFGIDLAD